MKTKFVTFIVGILALNETAVLHLNAQSVPNLVNYQGRLTDQTGAGLQPASYQIQFRLWDSATPGANLLRGQQQTAVVQSNGAFAVLLRAANSPPPPAFISPAFQSDPNGHASCAEQPKINRSPTSNNGVFTPEIRLYRWQSARNGPTEWMWG